MPFETPMVGDVPPGVLDHPHANVVESHRFPDRGSNVARMFCGGDLRPVRDRHCERRHLHISVFGESNLSYLRLADFFGFFVAVLVFF